MKSNRRNFIRSTGTIGALSACFPFVSKSSVQGKNQVESNYSQLDAALKKPVLKRALFSQPVMIETLELLLDRKNCIYRVRSKEGAEGISIGHPFIAQVSYPMVPLVLERHFVGKDARDLD